MEQSAINRPELSLSKQESARYEIQAERKAEELKLDRLKKLLQTKVYAAADASAGIRAA